MSITLNPPNKGYTPNLASLLSLIELERFSSLGGYFYRVCIECKLIFVGRFVLLPSILYWKLHFELYVAAQYTCYLIAK